MHFIVFFTFMHGCRFQLTAFYILYVLIIFYTVLKEPDPCDIFK